jgi:uncharacterized phiE125 gp8 family phage protein
MWYPATITAAPETEPVTITQARQQCVGADTSSGTTDTLNRLIASERGFVEKYCGIKIVTQTLTLKCDSFSNFERVPAAPVQSVTSVNYTDVNGASQLLDPAIYEVRSDGLDVSIVLQFGQAWPNIQRGSRIIVVVVAGFTEVPDDLVSAMLLRIGNGYYISKRDPTLRLESIEGVLRRDWDNTGAMDTVFRKAVSDLLENYRCWMAL